MNILKISLVIAIVGIIALYFVTRITREEVIEIKNVKIGQRLEMKYQFLEGLMNIRKK